MSMPVYHCTNCHFTFKREGKVDSCPDCGKPDVRPATEAEIKEFQRYVAESWDEK